MRTAGGCTLCYFAVLYCFTAGEVACTNTWPSRHVLQCQPETSEPEEHECCTVAVECTRTFLDSIQTLNI